MVRRAITRKSKRPLLSALMPGRLSQHTMTSGRLSRFWLNAFPGAQQHRIALVRNNFGMSLVAPCEVGTSHSVRCKTPTLSAQRGNTRTPLVATNAVGAPMKPFTNDEFEFINSNT